METTSPRPLPPWLPPPPALLVLLFAVTFPLWSNAYLAPPDAASYVAVARSAVLSGDLDFADDYEALGFNRHHFYLTEAGRVSNDWPAGSGILWFPAYGAAHGLALGASALGVEGYQFSPEDPPRTRGLPRPLTTGAHEPNLAPTGQSGIHRLGLTLWTGAFALGALLIGWRMAAPHAGRWHALAAAVLVLLGTPVGFYTYAFAMMSHVNSMLTVGVLLYAWHRTRGERTARQWALLGLIAGVVAMVRPQDAAFLCVFLVELLWERPRGREAWLRWARGVAIAAGAALAAFLPQMILWWRLYGNPLQLPKIEEMHWLRPRLWDALLSEYHGLLSWSPVLALVPVGALFLWRRDRVLAAGLGTAVLVQVWLNAANEIWWAGGSFGARRFVNCGVPFAVLLAAALAGARLVLVYTVAALLAGWNLLLWAAERAGEISLAYYTPWDGAFLSTVLAMANPARFAPAMMGDFAGFGWMPRLVAMALGVAVAAALWRGWAPWRSAALRSWGLRLAVGYFAVAMPVLFLVLALRTPERSPEDFPGGVYRENRSLFDGYYEYGFFNLAKGRFAEARTAYEEAAARRPDLPMPYRYLATIALGHEEDPAEAARLAGIALDLDPRYTAALELKQHALAAVAGQEPHRIAELNARWEERLRAAGLLEE